METKKVELMNWKYVYVAADGTEFDDKGECEGYEKSAKGVVRARVKELVINEGIECDLFETGGENKVWVCLPKSKDDIDRMRQLFLLYDYGKDAAVRAENSLKYESVGKVVFLTFSYDDADMWVTTLDGILGNIFGKRYEANVTFKEKSDEPEA